MKLIAKKPCYFDKQYFPGDEISADAVLDPKQQEKRDVLVCVNENGEGADPARSAIPAPSSPITILLPTEEGELVLEPSVEGIQSIFSVLTSNVDDAKNIIQGMTDGDALILLHMSDSRKGVKDAAEDQAKSLPAEESEEEGDQ